MIGATLIDFFYCGVPNVIIIFMWIVLSYGNV